MLQFRAVIIGCMWTVQSYMSCTPQSFAVNILDGQCGFITITLSLYNNTLHMYQQKEQQKLWQLGLGPGTSAGHLEDSSSLCISPEMATADKLGKLQPNCCSRVYKGPVKWWWMHYSSRHMGAPYLQCCRTPPRRWGGLWWKTRLEYKCQPEFRLLFTGCQGPRLELTAYKALALLQTGAGEVASGRYKQIWRYLRYKLCLHFTNRFVNTTPQEKKKNQ